MNDVPQSLMLFPSEDEESKRAPLSALQEVESTPTVDTQSHPDLMNFDEDTNNSQNIINGKRVFDYDTETVENSDNDVKPNMLKYMSEYIQKNQLPAFPLTTKIVLNDDSSLSTVEASTDDSSSKVLQSIMKAREDLLDLAKIDSGLQMFLDAEQSTEDRQPVFIHFMVGDIPIKEYSGFIGDKIELPSSDQVTKLMGEGWDSQLFAGWLSDGVIHSNEDIHAVLHKTFEVRTLIDGKELPRLKAVEGTKTTKFLEDHLKEFNFIAPLFTNYAIYCAHKIIEGNTLIRLECKTQAARERLGSVSANQVDTNANMVTVVFALNPADFGMDISTMSKEELRRATIIHRVQIESGSYVQPPSDEILAEHGLKLPFSENYKWSRSLRGINSNTIVYAIPLSIKDKSQRIAADVREMSSDDMMNAGKGALTQAFGVLKHPIIALAERKIVKEFERGRQLKTRDFIFLKRRGELMLYRYTGVNSVVEIPAMVNGMYVKYLHPRVFSKGPVKSFLRSSLSATYDRLNCQTENVTGLILPKTIKYLPSNFLFNVAGVRVLLVPETVTEISPSAFAGSSLEELYFDGSCPRGFDYNNVEVDIFVRRKQYKSFFG